MVKNYMETLVADALQKELRDFPEKYTGLCHCPECITAVEVIALNELTPFYVTCVAGEVYGEYHNKALQMQSDVMVAVSKGIGEVTASPPHK